MSGQDPPASNRLSDAPAAPRRSDWDRSRDSLRAVHEMVAPDDLSVVFQPIVNLANTRLFAYEALVRCRVPQYANPLVLFQQAVAAGCAGRMGRMIREIAVQLAGSTPLFVNVHPQELSESWLVRPDDPIYQHDDEVYLELTESVPLTHFDLCLNVLREVRNRGGVHLVVDDLGAGYSKPQAHCRPRAPGGQTRSRLDCRTGSQRAPTQDGHECGSALQAARRSRRSRRGRNRGRALCPGRHRCKLRTRLRLRSPGLPNPQHPCSPQVVSGTQLRLHTRNPRPRGSPNPEAPRGFAPVARRRQRKR